MMPFPIMTEDSGDVIAEAYANNNKKDIFREKLLRRTGKKPKTIPTTYVKKPEKKEPNNTVPFNPSLQHRCPCLALASSSVVKPMIQIQNALENKIASLVDTLKIVDAAEKKYAMTRYCPSNDLNPEKNVISQPSYGENTIIEQSKKAKKDINFEEKLSEKGTFPASYLDDKSKGVLGTVKNCGDYDSQNVANCHERSLNLKAVKPHQVFLQTPIARRKPPQPHYRNQKGNTNSRHVPPRMSKKGCALLCEILDDHEIKDLTISKNNTRFSSEENISFQLGRSNLKGSNTTPTSKNLHAKVEHLMEKTTNLKENLKEVNKDVETLLEKYNAPQDMNNIEVEKLFLREVSLSEECPIDKYLIYPQYKALLKENYPYKAEYEGSEFTTYITSVLQAAEEQRKILESNIDRAIRKPVQFDDEPVNEREVNTVRIKKAVNKKIIEIEKEIKVEMKNKVDDEVTCKSYGRIQRSDVLRQKTNEQSVTSKGNKKEPTIEMTKNIQLSQKTFQKKAKALRKKNPICEPPPSSATAYDELIYRHFNGSNSPTCSKQKPSTKKTTSNDKPLKESRPAQIKSCSQEMNNGYFFQPRDILQKDSLSLVGKFFPIATSLNDPSMDPSLRLPLYNHQNAISHQRAKSCKFSASSNIGVVNIKHIETDDSVSSRIDELKAKVRKRVKEKMKLNSQVLPNVDIDTSESSTSSISSHNINRMKSINESKNISPKADKMKKVLDEKVHHFEEFVSVQDIVSDKKRDENTGNVIDEEESMEDGVMQPPFVVFDGEKENREQNKCNSFAYLQQNNAISSVKTNYPLEQKAHEWLEQELLSRIIVQLNTQNPKPTLEEAADNVQLQEMKEIEGKDLPSVWIDNVIGLRGIQLFVDAGIPIDGQLITDLTRSVILERLQSIFGFAEPVMAERSFENTTFNNRIRSDVTTTLQTPIWTPDLEHTSICHQNDVRTPSQSTISDLKEQSLHDTQLFSPNFETKDENTLVTTPVLSDDDYRGDEKNETTVKSIITPEDSVCENINDIPLKDEKHLQTPDVTEMKEFSFVEEKDFSIAGTRTPEKIEDGHNETPIISQVVYPPPTPSPSTAFTFSSSTAVGLSTFEGISEGEHMLPDDVVSDENCSGGVVKPIMLALTAVGNIDTNFQSDYQTMEICDLLQKGIRKAESTVVLRSEGEYIFKVLDDERNCHSVNDERTVVDEDLLGSLYQSYEYISVPENITPVAPTSEKTRKSSLKLSEGEYFSKTNVASSSRDINDMLSTEPLLSKEHTTKPPRLTPRVITVRSADDEQDVDNQSKSEGEILKSHDDLNECSIPAQYVGKMTNEFVDTCKNDVSLATDDRSLIEYDISTLSGGEL